MAVLRSRSVRRVREEEQGDYMNDVPLSLSHCIQDALLVLTMLRILLNHSTVSELKPISMQISDTCDEL
jgi:hypothetical protein